MGCIPRCLLQGYSVIIKRNSGVSLSANFEAMKGFPRTYRLTACNYSYIQLIDFNARFYSPRLGRFIQPDSVIPDLTNSQAWNRYSYVLNSPIKYVDPSGHIPEGECGFSYGGCGTEGEIITNLDPGGGDNRGANDSVEHDLNDDQGNDQGDAKKDLYNLAYDGGDDELSFAEKLGMAMTLGVTVVAFTAAEVALVYLGVQLVAIAPEMVIIEVGAIFTVELFLADVELSVSRYLNEAIQTGRKPEKVELTIYPFLFSLFKKGE